MERLMKWLAKGFLLTACCAGAAASTMRALQYEACNAYYRDINQAIGVIGVLLLLATIVAGYKLGHQRKHSESWAVLAYGSWMTMHCVDLLRYVLPFSSDSPSAFGTLLLTTPFVWGGLREAFRGRWGLVFAWWFWSLSLVALRVLWLK
jgi:hypothetical protein